MDPKPGGVGPPLFVVPDWAERYPWVFQGTTGAGDGRHDYGLFGTAPVGESMARWRTLRETAGFAVAVHARQVHGRRVLEHGAGPGHRGSGRAGLFVAGDADGHVTDQPDVLLTVSLADCVPIFLVAPARRRVALLHGGWRGTAAGMVEAGLEALGGAAAVGAAHLGPAICGACYEVGPEVHEALGLPAPEGPSPVDVRAVQARQLVAAGVAPASITVSEHCTLHGDGFHSHRGGSAGRQLGLLGVRVERRERREAVP